MSRKCQGKAVYSDSASMNNVWGWHGSRPVTHTDSVRRSAEAKPSFMIRVAQLRQTTLYWLQSVKPYGNQHHVPINQLGISWHGLCILSVSMEGVTNMTQKPVDDGFIGPIKPQMSMTYRDFLMMINTGLGLPQYPTTGVPVVKTEDDFICPPANYRLN